jgi:hypothetical protein
MMHLQNYSASNLNIVIGMKCKKVLKRVGKVSKVRKVSKEAAAMFEMLEHTTPM